MKSIFKFILTAVMAVTMVCFVGCTNETAPQKKEPTNGNASQSTTNGIELPEDEF